jgi:hypothetical protein
VDQPVYPWWLWVAGPTGSVLAVLYAAGIGRPRHADRPGRAAPPGAPSSQGVSVAILQAGAIESLAPRPRRPAERTSDDRSGPASRGTGKDGPQPERSEIDNLLRAVARGDARLSRL